jgi:hypothetical protein
MQALPTPCLPYACKTSSGLLHNLLLIIDSDLCCSNVLLCPWWHRCKLPQLCYLGTCTQAEECCWYVKPQASVVSIATMQEAHLHSMSLDCRWTFTSCRHQSQRCYPARFWRYHSSNWGRNCCSVDLGTPGTTHHICRWDVLYAGLDVFTVLLSEYC